MARTLVIKNANFSENKVTTVVFASVPCTGIAFSESSYTITNQEPVEVEYTLTPADTTDTVTWSSSDTDVVTITDGVMTIVGIGTATITATCGEFNATASVSVDIAYIPTYAGGADTTINTGVSPNFTAIADTSNRCTAYGSGAQATTNKARHRNNWTVDEPAIKLPGNVERVRISRTTGSYFYNTGTACRILWTKDEDCGNTSYPSIKPISSENFGLASTSEHIFNVPSGADSFFVTVRLTGSPSTQSDYETMMESSGFTIEFLGADAE